MVSGRPRRLGKGCQADPQQGGIRHPLLSLRAPTSIIEQLQGAIEPLQILARIIGEAGSTLIREPVRRNEVAPTHLGWVQRQVSGDQVHGALQTKRRLGATGAPVGPGWGLIGHGAVEFQVDGRDLIRTRDTSYRIEWRRRGRQEKVGPNVRHNTYPYPEEHTITAHCRFNIQAHASAMVRQHILSSLLRPFHRPTEVPGEIWNQYIFGEDAILDAKAAPNIRSDY